ncbi:phosphopyruvate hydratase [Candidatus Gottesmanbacteria bacterium]|nr:phosphopyruvate hydratase [Candidatus Gottesmanbacteria bacterium]
MAKIVDIKCREILDSRGNPTVEAEVILDNGISASASVPSGASTGTHEAYELRDNDFGRFNGLGVLKALDSIKSKIKPVLMGCEICNQEKIDKTLIDLDGTNNKGKLGANSILAVSLSSARTAALFLKLPLYKYIQKLSANKYLKPTVTPLFNVINGGLHGSGKLDFQEFFIIPSPDKPFAQALQTGAELYQQLKKLLKSRKLYYSLGDEGGFTPNLETNIQALELLEQLISASKYRYGQDVYLGIDLAASVFYKDGNYLLNNSSNSFARDDFINYLADLKKKFCLYLLEDPLFEDDWQGFSQLNGIIGEDTLIVGDDLLVTNKQRLEKAIRQKACNSILIKVNQTGTLTEALEVIRLAQKAKFKVVVSHRSGETNDDFIADLAVGAGADYVKFGAPARGERVAKYNRLLRIYGELNF